MREARHADNAPITVAPLRWCRRAKHCCLESLPCRGWNAGAALLRREGARTQGYAAQPQGPAVVALARGRCSAAGAWAAAMRPARPRPPALSTTTSYTASCCSAALSGSALSAQVSSSEPAPRAPPSWLRSLPLALGVRFPTPAAVTCVASHPVGAWEGHCGTRQSAAAALVEQQQWPLAVARVLMLDSKSCGLRAGSYNTGTLLVTRARLSRIHHETLAQIYGLTLGGLGCSWGPTEAPQATHVPPFAPPALLRFLTYCAHHRPAKDGNASKRCTQLSTSTAYHINPPE